MVVMTEVAEFVKEDIISQYLGKAYEIDVKIDIILGGATAPVGGIMLDRYPIIYKAISVCQLLQTRWQFCLCYCSQLLYLLWIGGDNIAVFSFLLLYDSYDFSLIQFEKGLRCHVWHKVRHDDRNALCRVNSDAHASGTGILPEDDFA